MVYCIARRDPEDGFGRNRESGEGLWAVYLIIWQAWPVVDQEVSTWAGVLNTVKREGDEENCGVFRRSGQGEGRLQRCFVVPLGATLRTRSGGTEKLKDLFWFIISEGVWSLKKESAGWSISVCGGSTRNRGGTFNLWRSIPSDLPLPPRPHPLKTA